MATESQELKLTFTHRAASISVSVPCNSSLKQLGELLQQVTGIVPDTMKLLVPQGPRTALKPFLEEHAGLSILDCSLAEGKNVRLMGTLPDELIDVAQQQKASNRIIGFDEEDYRARQRSKPVGRSLKLPEGQYVFGSFKTLELPGIQLSPPPAQALQLMHALASDRGIVAIMNKYRWRVGIMSEMAPEGLVGISPVCLLGLNKNRGEEISLRLRTDDLKGFRKYENIKKTLLHELAHMIHDEHDDNFHRLDRQLNREAVELDWTRSKGRSVSGMQDTGETSIDEEVHGASEGQTVGGTLLAGSIDARTAAAIAALNRYSARAEPDPDDSVDNMEEDRKESHKPEQVAAPEQDQTSRSANEPDPDDMLADADPKLKAEAELDPDDSGESDHMNINQQSNAEPDPDDTKDKRPVEEPLQTNDPELRRILDVTTTASGRLQKSLEKLKSEASPSDVSAACQTLLTILGNIMEHPDDEKYRRLRKTNPVFHKRVARFEAAVELLQVVGFTDEAEYKEYLILKRSDPGLLWLARTCLEAAA